MTFSPNALPPAAQQSFANPANTWEVTAVAAFDSGMTNRDTLADIAFYHQHRELIGRPLNRSMANYDALAKEWMTWRDAVNTMFGPGYGDGGASTKPAAKRQDENAELKANLAFARSAVSYTKSVLPHGASNRLDDVVDSAGLSILAANAAKLAGFGIDVGRTWNMNEISLLARYAKAFGGGNCGEQAAVAFVFLHYMGVGPIDIMSRVHADHQFVVIGRTGLPQKPLEWGLHAVVCDPWMKKAYPAHQIGVYMAPNVWTHSTIRKGEQFCRIERK